MLSSYGKTADIQSTLFLTQQLLPHLLALYPRLVIWLCPRRISRLLRPLLRPLLLLLLRGEPDCIVLSSATTQHQTNTITHISGEKTHSTYPTSTTPLTD